MYEDDPSVPSRMHMIHDKCEDDAIFFPKDKSNF